MTGTLTKNATYYSGNGGRTVFNIKYAAAKDEKGKRTKGLFFNCTAWGDLAQLAACLEKGDGVLVCGRVDERRYRATDGTDKTWTELICDYIAPQPMLPAPEEMPESEEAGGTECEAEAEFDYIPSI